MPDAAGNSLVIAGAFGTFDLLGNPNWQLYRGQQAWDMGSPAPDIAVIVGNLLSGDRVSGTRSGNRPVVLPLLLRATSTLTRAGNLNGLLRTVDCQPPNDSFHLLWTPAGGKTVIYDCFRGGYQRPRSLAVENAGATVVILSFQASPFGRSDIPQSIAVAVPQTQIDAMDATTPPTNTTRDTAVKYEGTASARITLTRRTSSIYFYYDSPTVSRTITAIDLSAMSSISFRMRWPSPTSGTGTAKTWKLASDLDFAGSEMTLSDGTRSATVAVPSESFPSGDTSQHLISVPLSAFLDANPLLNLAHITSWSLLFATQVQYMTNAPASTSSMWIDDLRAYPSSSTAMTTAEGAVLTVPAVLGTAPAPAAIAVSRPGGGTMADLLVHRPPADQSPDAQILSPLSGTPKTVTIPAANNTFKGTYDIVLVATTLGSGTRTVTVQIDHKQGATTIGSEQESTTYTNPPTGKLIVVGRVTLPIVPVPAENVSDTIVITVTSVGGTADTFASVALLDTRGETQIFGALLSGTTVVYIDEPESIADIGEAYASATDRTAGTGLLGAGASTRADGGPIAWQPGDNRLMLVSSSGAPQMASTHYPRWHEDRVA